jgi:hypothetical protein
MKKREATAAPARANGGETKLNQDANHTPPPHRRQRCSRELARFRAAEIRKLYSRDFGFRNYELETPWEEYGFFIANTIALFPAGRFFQPGRKVPDRWPDLTLETVIGRRGPVDRLKLIEEMFGAQRREQIETAIIKGMKRGQAWTLKHRCLIGGEVVAKHLNVHQVEREASRVRTVGAVDMPKQARSERAAENRKQRDIERKRLKRRAEQKPERADYLASIGAGAAAAQAAELGVSKSTIYRLKKKLAIAAE